MRPFDIFILVSMILDWDRSTHSAAPKPSIAIPAMICVFDCAVAVIRWPMKQMTCPMMRNHRRPSISVLAPAIINAITISIGFSFAF